MSDIVRVRLPENLKDEVTNLYENLGITLTQAVKMFFKQSVIDGGLPFQPQIKLKTKIAKDLIDDDLTDEELREIKRRLKGKSTKENVRNLFKRLEKEINY